MSPFRRIQPSALEQNERKAMLYPIFMLSETQKQTYVIQPQGAPPTPQQLLLDLCNQQQSYFAQLQGALVSFPTSHQLLLDLCNQQQSYVIQLQGALVAFTTPHQLLLDLCNNHSWLLQCASTQPGTSQRKSDRFHNVSSETDLFCTGSIVRQEQLTVYKDCRLSSTAYLVQGYRDYSLVRNSFLCTGTIVHQKQLTLYRDYPIVHQKQLTLYRDYRSSERAYFV